MATGEDRDTAIVIEDSDDGKGEVLPLAGRIPGAGPSRTEASKKSAAAVPAQKEIVVLTDSDEEIPGRPLNPAAPPSRHAPSASLAGDYEVLRVDTDPGDTLLHMITTLTPQLPAATTSSLDSSERRKDTTTTKIVPSAPSSPLSISSAPKPGSKTFTTSLRPRSKLSYKHLPPEANPTASSSHAGNSSKVRNPSPMIISSDSDREQASHKPPPRPFSRPFVSAPVSKVKLSKSSFGTPTIHTAAERPTQEEEKPDEYEKQWIQSFAAAIDTSGEANASSLASASAKPKSKTSLSRGAGGHKLKESDSTIRKARVQGDTTEGTRYPERRRPSKSSTSSRNLYDNDSATAPFPLPGSRAHEKLTQIQSSNNPSVHEDSTTLSKTMSKSAPFSYSPASKTPKDSTGHRSTTTSGQISRISSTLTNDHGERDSSDSDSKDGEEGRAKDVNELFSFLGVLDHLTKDNGTVDAGGAAAADGKAQEQRVQKVQDAQSQEPEEQVHPTQILKLKESLQAMEIENSSSPHPDSEQGVSGTMQAEEELASDGGLPPLDYDSVEFDSSGGEDEEEVHADADAAMDSAAEVQGHATIDSAAEAEGDVATVERSPQRKDDNVDLAKQLNSAYAKQGGGGAVSESGTRSGFTSDSEVLVQNMLETDNDRLSPLSPIPSSHSATIAESLAEVHKTDLALAERSFRSRSPSSEDTPEVALRRSSRARRPPQRSDSDYTSSSSVESLNSRGHYDSSVSSNQDETPPRSTTPEDFPEGKSSSNFPSMSLGGLPVVTWFNRREWLRHQPPPHRYSKDLKHEFHDYINSYHPEMRHYHQMTQVYEAMMFENTCKDEPNAPPIKVQNDVDNDESTPPWEFLYTNEMWLGEGVSPPSRVNLVGCDCEGKCTKKTCKCWKRQEEHTLSYGIDGFMYDSNGLLKMSGHPVFECNSLCNCGEECKNRVVGEGRKCKVIIKKTRRKGWGIFACERIPKGTFIGIYSGELLGHEESEKRAVKYDEFGRTYLFDIDWWYMPNNQEPIPAHDKAGDTDRTPAKKVVNSNDHSDSDSETDGEKRRPAKYTIDAYHAGNFTRFLNHSCDPNAALTPVYIDADDIERPLLTIFSRRDIQMNEEITFSYSGDIDDDEEESQPQSQHTPKRGRKKKKKTNAKHNSSDTEETRVHVQCQCGAANCKGKLWRT